jgi:uncharacterized protein (TIGR02444 family)
VIAAPVNPFWRFSLRVYRLPGVQEACLALQDRCHADVNLLLVCGWTGRHGRELDDARLRSAVGRVAGFQSDVIAPLRMARRALKCQQEAGTLAVAVAFRRRIADIELDLERVEQSLLYELAGQWSPTGAETGGALTNGNLSRYLALLVPAPDAQDRAHADCIAQACSQSDAVSSGPGPAA